MMGKLLLLLLLQVLTIYGFGEECYLPGGVRGTCQLMSGCPAAIQARKEGKKPEICGFQREQPIVCCVETVATTARPQTTTARPQTTTARPQTTTTRPQVATTPRLPSSTTEYIPEEYEYELVQKFQKPSGCPPIDKTLTAPKTGQKAWDKCVDYQEYVYPCQDSETLALATSGGKVRNYRCKHNADSLIIGGVDAAEHEFPHMALLGYGENAAEGWKCGGTLISERFIMTAGHCLSARGTLGDTVQVTYARVGVLRRDDAAPRHRVVEAVRYPLYKPPFKYHDIALLKTEKPVELSATVVPACLYSPEHGLSDQRALATGWGDTQYNIASQSDVLQKVTLDKFSEQDCRKKFPKTRYAKEGFNSSTQICYGDHEESKDTCQGDSGGPLQIYNTKLKCMYSVVGVTSFGKGCGFVDQPGYYTNVAYYLPWIEQVVWP